MISSIDLAFQSCSWKVDQKPNNFLADWMAQEPSNQRIGEGDHSYLLKTLLKHNNLKGIESSMRSGQKINMISELKSHDKE